MAVRREWCGQMGDGLQPIVRRARPKSRERLRGASRDSGRGPGAPNVPSSRPRRAASRRANSHRDSTSGPGRWRIGGQSSSAAMVHVALASSAAQAGGRHSSSNHCGSASSRAAASSVRTSRLVGRRVDDAGGRLSIGRVDDDVGCGPLDRCEGSLQRGQIAGDVPVRNRTPVDQPDDLRIARHRRAKRRAHQSGCPGEQDPAGRRHPHSVGDLGHGSMPPCVVHHGRPASASSDASARRRRSVPDHGFL